jgi:hypothetical protein
MPAAKYQVKMHKSGLRHSIKVRLRLGLEELLFTGLDDSRLPTILDFPLRSLNHSVSDFIPTEKQKTYQELKKQLKRMEKEGIEDTSIYLALREQFASIESDAIEERRRAMPGCWAAEESIASSRYRDLKDRWRGTIRGLDLPYRRNDPLATLFDLWFSLQHGEESYELLHRAVASMDEPHHLQKNCFSNILQGRAKTLFLRSIHGKYGVEQAFIHVRVIEALDEVDPRRKALLDTTVDGSAFGSLDGARIRRNPFLREHFGLAKAIGWCMSPPQEIEGQETDTFPRYGFVQTGTYCSVLYATTNWINIIPRGGHLISRDGRHTYLYLDGEWLSQENAANTVKINLSDPLVQSMIIDEPPTGRLPLKVGLDDVLCEDVNLWSAHWNLQGRQFSIHEDRLRRLCNHSDGTGVARSGIQGMRFVKY